MIRGATHTVKVAMPAVSLDLVDSIIFTFKLQPYDAEPVLQKTYPGEVEAVNGELYVLLSQEDTLLFTTDRVSIEAQINYSDKSVVKTKIPKLSVNNTLATKVIEGNKANPAQPDYVEMTTETVTYLNMSLQTISNNVELSQTARAGAESARDGAVSAKNTSVEQANSASLNKDATDSNVTTTVNLATQVSQDKQTVDDMVTEGRALLEEQRRLIGSMPTTYIAQTIDEMQSIDSPIARDICLVLGNTQAAYMYYTTAIDGTPLSNPAWVWVSDIQMVAPTKDYLLNILQLPTVATTGSYNDLADKPNRYESYATITDGVWDYAVTDKIKLTADLVSIVNVYNGAVGIIQSDINITLPTNSKTAIDWDYMTLGEGQIWQYTWVYDGSYYHWSRTVIA